MKNMFVTAAELGHELVRLVGEVHHAYGAHRLGVLGGVIRTRVVLYEHFHAGDSLHEHLLLLHQALIPRRQRVYDEADDAAVGAAAAHEDAEADPEHRLDAV